MAHEAEVDARGGHQVVEQLRASRSRQLVERQHSGIGDGSTESLDGLLLARLLLDGELPVVDAGVGSVQNGRLSGAELILAIST